MRRIADRGRRYPRPPRDDASGWYVVPTADSLCRKGATALARHSARANFHRLPAILGDRKRTTCSTTRAPIRPAENASLVHINQGLGTMVGGSVSEVSGTIELSNEPPGTMIGSQPGSHIGSQLGSHIGTHGGAHGSHSTPRFLRHKFDKDQFDGPRHPSADTTTTSAKNVSLFITSFSAQATCIHHGDCRPHKSTTRPAMCKFNRCFFCTFLVSSLTAPC